MACSSQKKPKGRIPGILIRTNTKSGNKPHKEISKRLKLCTLCNKVYEMEYQTRKILYYRDFPTYGLERKHCKRHRKAYNE